MSVHRALSTRRRRRLAGLGAAAVLAAALPSLVGASTAVARTGQAIGRSATATAVQDERVTFTSGGTTVVGHHFRASSAPGRPIVVMAPGFGSLQSGRLRPFALAFAAAGYDTLSFDYRSWGESAGTPRNVLDLPRQLADWRAAVSTARHLPGIDPNRVVLWGSSLAGGHVLEVASGDHRLAAVISQVPQVDGLAAASDPSKPLAVTTRLATLGAQDAAASLTGGAVYIPIVGRPGDVAALTAPGAYEGYLTDAPAGWTNRVAARIILQVPFYSPKNDAPRSTAPTFIGVGSKDTLVSPSAAIALAKTMHAETHVYDGGHFDVYQPHPVYEQILGDELAFLRAHVRPAPLTTA
jgi:fermentation-respiration switch protein FrsA (DUF1100 family)